MKCYGTCQFLKGLWMDIIVEAAEIYVRTDANNLVTTAGATHLPEQKETIHMIQMMRKELCSGAMDDLAHIRTEYCLSDCLTKHSAKPDNLIEAVETGRLPFVDNHPLYRTLIKHKAFLVEWLSQALAYKPSFQSYVCEDVSDMYFSWWNHPDKRVLTCTVNFPHDIWSHDKHTNTVRCTHVHPRRLLCIPVASLCPVSIDLLSDMRKTIIQTNANNICVIDDNWRENRKNRKPHTPYHWTGYSIFWLKEGSDRGRA